jgi:NTE family protein
MNSCIGDVQEGGDAILSPYERDDAEQETSASEPVRYIPGDEADGEPTDGKALCLSGGGYRAMLFHVGVLWRLNDAGLLRRLDRVSSVSGGSITAGVLAHRWHELDFDGDVARNLGECLVEPIRRMGHRSIDVSSVLKGILSPFSSVSDRVVDAYRDHLFGDATLQDLPDEPRFVINATNLESGVLMRFSKPYLADWRVGSVRRPRLPLAVAVAASSAFPPILSPCTLDLRHETWTTEEGNDLTAAEWRGKVRCSDGGVYDNLGLETAWKRARTVIVSDAGGRLTPDPDPASDWARHSVRVLKVIDNQVRSLRKRQVIDAFKTNRRDGTYIGIRSQVADYPLADAMQADPAVTNQLAATATRLTDLDDERQELLINWGYTICDAGLRAHLDTSAERGTLPYPSRPLT